jgi:SAM-dependent methyltransferase
MNDVFDAYAAYYDLFNSDKDYAAEAAYVEALLRRCAPACSNVLELGCGTAAHAIHLANAGFSVVGVDMSQQMLAQAEMRKTALPEDVAARLTFQLCDARRVDLECRFDAVVALFHVMSYQTADADIKALFNAAASHLKPGGAFVCDFWHGPAVLSQLPDVRIKRRDAAGLSVERLAEPELFLAENRVAVTYTIRIDTDPDCRPDEISECHNIRYFFQPELRRFSQEHFEHLDTFAWMTDRAPDLRDWSAVTVFRRK